MHCVLTLVAAVTVYSHPACSLKVSRGTRRQWDLSMCQEGSTTPTEASCLGTSTVHPWWACCQYGCWRIIIQNQSCRLSISFSIYDTQVSTGVVSLKPGFPFQILFAPLEKKLWNKEWKTWVERYRVFCINSDPPSYTCKASLGG